MVRQSQGECHSKLTKTELEVLHMISIDFLTPQQIAIRRKTKVFAVYKILKKIQEKGHPLTVNKKQSNELIEKEINNPTLLQHLKYHKEYQKCCICGHPLLDIHHIKRKLDTLFNLLPLCPNHHAEIERNGYSDEMIEKIVLFLGKIIEKRIRGLL